jgi:hypothetical protein
MMNDKKLRVGVVFWQQDDEIGSMIADTLENFQCRTINFLYNKKLPEALDAVLVYGPLGSLVPLANQLLTYPLSQRPLFIMWMTEQFPNPELPEWIRHQFGMMRSRLERLVFRQNNQDEWQVIPYLRWVTRKMNRFRYFGDLYWLSQENILSILAIPSPWIANSLYNQGFNPIIADIGFDSTCSEWVEDLGLKRDIPVLWLGKTEPKRRKRILMRIQAELKERGIDLLMVDGVHHPYVFGKERTRLLNRTKIVLNVLRAEWDDNAMRYCLAAPNRALIVTEPTLNHTPFVSNIHLVEANVNNITDRICYYLSHEEEREEIVEQAYQLVTTEMTMQSGVEKILEQVALLQGKSNKMS